MKIEFQPIGTIHTPHKTLEGMPIQPAGAAGVQGQIEIREAYAPGLQDLEGFSHVVLIYFLHASKGYQLKVIPFLDDRHRGLFATRAPRRPNAIGLSVVKLIQVRPPWLMIENVDILDQTPLLDIKPYVPEFDRPESIRTGWLEDAARRAAQKRSDDRFVKQAPPADKKGE